MRKQWVIAGLVGIVLLMMWHLSIGSSRLDVWLALQDLWLGRDSVAATIVRDIRLPRLVLAMAVGGVLGLSGAAMQSLLRNPLADPGLVGVSNFAALGAVVSLYFGWAALAWWILPVGGMLGAALAVVAIFALAGLQSNGLSLILAGVAVNALAGSLIALALNFSSNPYAMSEIVYWLLGSFANRSVVDVAIAIPFMVLGAVAIFISKNFLDALSLGEETAQSLGYHLVKYRSLIIVGVALSVGAAVSVSGNIGFVGLVIPHLVRPLVQHRPSKLLLASTVAGAGFMLLADILVQVFASGQELKLGVVTALVGGPFFLGLIWRLRRSYV
ncbi:MAG TPA: iron ABC transporter permease [Pseudomonadales bacterium]|nr:iron ABC transporter permease [Pseudomonadales bacterium]